MSKTRCKEPGLDKYYNFYLLAKYQCEKCGARVADKKFVCKPLIIEKEKLSLI